MQSQIPRLRKNIFCLCFLQVSNCGPQCKHSKAVQGKAKRLYKAKTTWARLIQAGVCLKNAPCFKIQNTAGQKCQKLRKNREIKYKLKFGKSISLSFSFSKKNVFL